MNNLYMATIIIIFLAVLTIRENNKYLVLAMLFTVIADLFLLIINIYPVGVAVFCVAHLFHIIRLHTRAANTLPVCDQGRYNKKVLKYCILTLLPPIVLLILRVELLNIIASIYAQLFVINFVMAIWAVKKGLFPKPNSILLIVGLSAFVACDILVVMMNLGIGSVSPTAIWLFYAPSQIFIVLSGVDVKVDARLSVL